MRLFSVIRNLFKRSDDERQWSELIPNQSATGIDVTPDNATRSSAVYGCVRVLAETIATLPFMMYKRDGDARKKFVKHPLYRLLHDSPNRWQTSFEFREMIMGHVLLRGNAYCQKVYNSDGAIIELVPLNPTRTEPYMDKTGDVYYLHRPLSGGQRVLKASEVFHLKGYAPDGLVGTSPISHAAETVGLALAAEEFGARTFANDAQPGGVLEHPETLGVEGLKNLRKSWEEQHSGTKNARKPLILEEGMKWTKIGMSPEDTQFLETRKFQIEEIARIFRVPPHLIGHLERATFSNIEHQALEFVTYTIVPWLERWEQAIMQRLCTESERVNLIPEFLVEGLLRGDVAARGTWYSTGRQWGWFSVNDVRQKENMEPIEGGDVYLVPMNMMDASRLDEFVDSQVAKPDTTQKTQENTPPTEPKQPQNTQSSRTLEAIEAFKPVLSDVVQRYIERISKSKKPISEHRSHILEGLKPAISGIFSLVCPKDSALKADICARTFFENWEKRANSTQEELVGDVVGLISAMSEINVITVSDETRQHIQIRNESPVINLKVEAPPATDKKVSWVTNEKGVREAIIKELPV